MVEQDNSFIKKDALLETSDKIKYYIMDVFPENGDVYLELIKVNDEETNIIGEPFGVKYIIDNGRTLISKISNIEFENIKRSSKL